MKTMSELNGHWWYRLVKVFYIGAFLLVVIGSGLVVYFLNQTHEVQDVKVTCLYGNRSIFNAYHDKGIDISTYDADKAIPSELHNEFLKACEISDTDIVQARLAAEEATAKMRKENNCDTSSTFGQIKKWTCTMKMSDDTYFTGWTSVTKTNVVQAILYVFADILILAILFELGRRLFYYVLFGTIRPRK